MNVLSPQHIQAVLEKDRSLGYHVCLYQRHLVAPRGQLVESRVEQLNFFQKAHVLPPADEHDDLLDFALRIPHHFFACLAHLSLDERRDVNQVEAGDSAERD